MSQQDVLARKGLKTPRAAVIAGMIFSVLLISSQSLIWFSLPANPSQSASDVISHPEAISLRFESTALRRHCFSVVHRGGTRSFGGA